LISGQLITINRVMDAEFVRHENKSRREANLASMSSQAVVANYVILSRMRGDKAISIECPDSESWEIQSISIAGETLADGTYVMAQSIISGSKYGEDRIRDLQIVVGDRVSGQFYRITDEVIEPTQLLDIRHRDNEFLKALLKDAKALVENYDGLFDLNTQLVNLLRQKSGHGKELVLQGLLSKS